MKMRRKKYLILILIAISFLFGCQSQKETVANIADEETVGKNTVSDVEAVAVETMLSTDGYKLVLGTLTDKQAGFVSIKTRSDEDLTFKLAPETVVYAGDAPELVVGDEVAVVFEGELEGLSTDKVKVITVSIAAEEKDKKADDENTDDDVKVTVTTTAEGYTEVSGTVTDASMNTITILTEEGNTILFMLNDDTKKNLVEGLLLDDFVTIVFEGDLKGTDASGVIVKSISE